MSTARPFGPVLTFAPRPTSDCDENDENDVNMDAHASSIVGVEALLWVASIDDRSLFIRCILFIC